MADSEIPEEEFDDGEMHWESTARGRVQEALEHIRFDELRGVIYLLSGEDHRMNRVEEEFETYDDMVTRLAEIYDEEWYANVPFEGGAAVFDSDSHGDVADMLNAFHSNCSQRLNGDVSTATCGLYWFGKKLDGIEALSA